MASSSELHLEIARDSALLSFFEVEDFVSLSVAVSAGLGAEVSFPDREDDGLGPVGDDSATMLDIAVFDRSEWLVYPFTVRMLLERILALYLASQPRQAWTDFEKQVFAVEGIGVRVSRQPFAPWERWGDVMGGSYDHAHAAPGSMTVDAWKRTRATLPPYFECQVLTPDGSSANGRRRMKKLRASWATKQRGLEPTVDALAFDIVRTARFFAAVERARSTE